ncbi:HlyD family efflux transporter periplasmic adaptor subunit [Croceicoccus marinus]|uniref:HlyD family efflux transporter periplasmic adaptor subunit n=1 Tax=Croceicoccus marinus TaxID=450378 RepID=A0A7G6VZJ5_9SPHN|nr:HlyD family efflux transporter periplasmic adaptor subunit [Croceicoccus marinus]QNE07160.1 HlyD family efflux transporter periplasmic adaptor subunit [Croceicoccus marinus]
MPNAPSSHLDTLDVVALDMPEWVRKGLALRVIAVLAIVFVVPLFIPWRATVELPLSIVTSEPPRSVRIEGSGPIGSVTASAGQTVARGEILGRIGPLSDHRDVDRFDRAVQAIAGAQASALPKLATSGGALPPLSVGGEVQDAHAALAQAIDQLANYKAYDDAQSDLRSLTSELAEGERQLTLEREELVLLQQSVALASEKLERRETGAERGWVSKDSLGTARAELVDRELAVQRARQGLIERAARIEQLRLRIEGQRLAQQGSSGQLEDSVRQAANRAAGAIGAWRRAHELAAPVRGEVKFPQQMRVGQYLDAGSEFAVIVPRAKGVMAVGSAPDGTGGEIMKAAPVRIFVPGFPVSSFGYLEGRVLRTSDVSANGQYQLVVALDDGFRTNAGIELPIRNRALVNASVVVRETTLGEAIVSDIGDRIRLL